ncbi:ead/Ea22-like family protein [Pseudomonas aeruginosa]|uniref:ead/Ea22-like family protein n=1 Tax=Pseudomonas aeruginosa TaxID=287 RepID=UPI003AD9616F
MTDHSELRRLAKAATPGPWGRDGFYIHTTRKEGGTTYVETWNTLAGIARKENAEFVAAANPKTILALLDEIDQLKAENEALLLGMRAILNAYDYADQHNKEGVAVEVMEDLRTLFKGATQ